MLPQYGPRTRKSAAHGAQGNLQHLGDRLIVKTLEFPQYQDRPMFFAHAFQGGGHLVRQFESFEARAWRFGLGCTVKQRRCSDLISGYGRSSLPFAGHCPVKGDSVQPGIKTALTAELFEVQIGLNEGLLIDIFGFRMAPCDMDKTGEQPILVSAYQLVKGACVTVKRLCDEPSLVVHRPAAPDEYGKEDRGKPPRTHPK